MAGHDTGTVIMSHAPSLKNYIKENGFMHSGIVLLALVMRVLRVRVLLVLILVLLSVNSETSTSI